MKTLKTISLSILAAAALANTASAVGVPGGVTVIHIAGSTAFRGPATAAVIDYLQAHTVAGQSILAAYDASSSSLLGANSAIITNGTVNGGQTGVTSPNAATIVFELAWTGSASGVVEVVAANSSAYYLDPFTAPPSGGHNSGPGGMSVNDINVLNSNLTANKVTFGTNNNTGYVPGSNPVTAGTGYGGGYKLVDSNVTTTNGVNNTLGITGGVAVPQPGSDGTVTAVADAAFTDVTPTSIAAVINSADNTISATHPLGAYTSKSALVSAIAAITDISSAGTVGAVPFQWVAGNINSTATASGAVIPTNMTQQTALALLTLGQVDQSFFTGTNNAADTNFTFNLIGRNEDSGTRINSFAESQFGVASAPFQYIESPNGSGNLGDIELYPAVALNTEPLITWAAGFGAGHSGYVSGSTVGAALSVPEDGTASNGNGNPSGNLLIGYMGVSDAAQKTTNCHPLTYNGVAFSIGAVENGSYSFWSLEHMVAKSTNANITALKTIANEIESTGADIDANGLHNDPSNANPDTTTAGGKNVAGGVLYPKLQVNRTATSPLGSPEGGYLEHN